MNYLPDLFERNRAWARDMRTQDPLFFEELAAQQTPEYLWIGCSDSRVPANQIIGMPPGSVFVHRNISNVVAHTDLNCLSVLQFAVDVLGVKHVIVCGHYGCGGVRAAMRGERLGLVDNWLRHVQDVMARHHALLDEHSEEDTRWQRLCELNVLEQVLNCCGTTVIQDAWTRGQDLTVHGWIYALHDGLLRDLNVSAGSPEEVAQKYAETLRSLGGA